MSNITSFTYLAHPEPTWPDPCVIAIDGPAGAGKSSVSTQLANHLTFFRLDTGVLYRGIALEATRVSLQAKEDSALQSFLDNFSVDLSKIEGTLMMNSTSAVDEALRTPENGKAASDFARLPMVRAKLLDIQRQLGSSAPCVVDGRDIGTVVFPDAPLKIFLTASADERAHRRLIELDAKGVTTTFDAVREGIIARDLQDSQRPIAPLKQADDAHLVDATELSLSEVVDVCLSLARCVFPSSVSVSSKS